MNEELKKKFANELSFKGTMFVWKNWVFPKEVWNRITQNIITPYEARIKELEDNYNQLLLTFAEVDLENYEISKKRGKNLMKLFARIKELEKEIEELRDALTKLIQVNPKP